MKKRIISLILVVATLLVALTGCSFNYGKADLAGYAKLEDAFFTALTDGSIKFDRPSFGEDEATRWQKVEEQLANALLSIAKEESTKYEGKPGAYDKLNFVYFATTKDGTPILTSNMEKAVSTTLGITLGTNPTEDAKFKNALSNALLAVEGELGAYYATSAEILVDTNDVVSITYKDKDGKLHEYESVSVTALAYSELIGHKIGDTVAEVTVKEEVTEGEGETATKTEKVTATYTEVKINAMIKDAKTTVTAAANDLVFVSYTATLDYTPAEGATVQSIKLGNLEFKLDSTGKYSCTVTTAPLRLGEKDTAAEGQPLVKTLKGQLVGKNVGASNTIDGVKETVTVTTKTGEAEPVTEEKVIDVKYTSTKINWIVKSGFGIADDGSYTGGFSFKYAPTLSNQKDIYGKTATLDGKAENELMYYVFPVSYVDTPEFGVDTKADGTFDKVNGLNATDILRNFYTLLLKTKTDEHDENEEHDHEALVHYVFDCVESDKYKNGEKTLETLLTELDKLLNTSTGTHTKNKTAYDKAITAIQTAQKNLAKETDTTKQDKLKTEVTNAITAYNKAKTEFDKTEKEVNDKIAEILACTGGDVAIADAICTDYTKYQYTTLEDSYKDAIKSEIFNSIMELAEKNFKYDVENLPKKALKDAKKSIINSYKNTFYTGKTSSATDAKTNYDEYNGNFNKFLAATINAEIKDKTGTAGNYTEKDTDKIDAYIESLAADTVADIMLIYVLADHFEETKLTKAEIKNTKKAYKNYKAQLEAYGLGSYLNYTVESAIHAAQFDKVMDYLLEYTVDENTNAITYDHVKYTFNSTEGENK